MRVLRLFGRGEGWAGHSQKKAGWYSIIIQTRVYFYYYFYSHHTLRFAREGVHSWLERVVGCGRVVHVAPNTRAAHTENNSASTLHSE